VLLTDREAKILPMIAAGLGDKEIGSALTLSPMTVSTYVRDLLRKLGAANRAELVAHALTAGVLVAADRDRPPVWSGIRSFSRQW
jgi:DNA-binding NarL/FixJ family response regulator